MIDNYIIGFIAVNQSA